MPTRSHRDHKASPSGSYNAQKTIVIFQKNIFVFGARCFFIETCPPGSVNSMRSIDIMCFTVSMKSAECVMDPCIPCIARVHLLGYGYGSGMRWRLFRRGCLSAFRS